MAWKESSPKLTSSPKSYSRDLLERELTRDEGKRRYPYKDTVGILTIGIGRNLEAKPLSDAAISLLFQEDIEEVERELDRLMPWWREMTDARQRALLNLGFNMGVGALVGTPTFKLMEQGRYEECADRLLRWKWASQVGKRAIRVTDMIRNG